MFFDSEVEIYYDLLKNDQILLQCTLWSRLTIRLLCTEPECLNFQGAQDRLQGTNSARLESLAGRYDNPMPSGFLAPIDCLKIPAQYTKEAT